MHHTRGKEEGRETRERRRAVSRRGEGGEGMRREARGQGGSTSHTMGDSGEVEGSNETVVTATKGRGGGQGIEEGGWRVRRGAGG